MVKLLNPLFSVNASGKLGGIVYQTGQYGNIARCHVPQHRKPTALQIQQNAFFGNAADDWRVLSQSEKDVWNANAVGKKMTGFNLYIKENIQHP